MSGTDRRASRHLVTVLSRTRLRQYLGVRRHGRYARCRRIDCCHRAAHPVRVWISVPDNFGMHVPVIATRHSVVRVIAIPAGLAFALLHDPALIIRVAMAAVPVRMAISAIRLSLEAMLADHQPLRIILKFRPYAGMPH